MLISDWSSDLCSSDLGGILSAVPEPAVARIVCGPTPFHSPFPIPHSRLSHHPMPAYASPTPPRSGDVAGPLRLLTYLALSVALIVLDNRGDVLTQIRPQANLALQTLWWLAGLPGRLGDSSRHAPVTRSVRAAAAR